MYFEFNSLRDHAKFKRSKISTLKLCGKQLYIIDKGKDHEILFIKEGQTIKNRNHLLKKRFSVQLPT